MTTHGDQKAANGGRGGARDGAHAGSDRVPYLPAEIEARRQAAWQERESFRTPHPEHGTPHRYIKPSAPFTSGNVHIGHVRSYSIGDAYARFWRARGDSVLFAFGFDAFGLPAEMGAIANKVSPAEWVKRCAERMRAQLCRLGFSFDWDRTFMSSDEVMYRWSQWLFLKLMANGLIYRGTGAVDWCDHCQTTLASIQVEDGLCWRCHNPVRLIQLPQWMLRISAYVPENDRRTAELEQSGIWDENSLASQRFVLGRVDGVEIDFQDEKGVRLVVFTPHREAAGMARFIAISPKHPEIDRWTAGTGVDDQLESLRAGGLERSAREAESLPVVDTGRRLRQVGGGEPLPLVISPLVDGRFGPTAVLGIPKADSTDEVIAQRIFGADGRDRIPATGEAGATPESRPQITSEEAAGCVGSQSNAVVAGEGNAVPGERSAVRYKADDFSISRQRSWGTPIPIVYCESCGAVPVPVEDLPVVLPPDVRPTGTGNPLAEMEEFVSTSCPACGGRAQRETDTLDCHFDALWLWVPVCVPTGERERSLDEIFALEDLRTWLPSERVVAGSDSGNFVFDQRIVTKALRDAGSLSFLTDGEPFAGCLFHEMVIRDGRKMSKHIGNVVEPDELVSAYGADTVRLAVLYAARPQRSLNWTDSAVQHCHRFLTQLWEYCQDQFAIHSERDSLPPAANDVGKQHTEHLRARLAKWCDNGLSRITQDVESLQMHSAVRNAMRLFERIQDFEARVLERRGVLSQEDSEALAAALAMLTQILAPFAPHVAEELWIASGFGVEGTDPGWPEPGAVERLCQPIG